MDWSSLPMDIVGVITSYTGKLKRRGDSFVNQIDIQSPALARVRHCLQKKAQDLCPQSRQPTTPFTEIPFSEMNGVLYNNTFYGYGSASFCRDGDTTWYKITEPWYICIKGNPLPALRHPYFKHVAPWI